MDPRDQGLKKGTGNNIFSSKIGSEIGPSGRAHPLKKFEEDPVAGNKQGITATGQ